MFILVLSGPHGRFWWKIDLKVARPLLYLNKEEGESQLWEEKRARPTESVFSMSVQGVGLLGFSDNALCHIPKK